jgi:hypothetical protein
MEIDKQAKFNFPEIRASLNEYLQSQNNAVVEGLCGGGSIWIKEIDVLRNAIDGDSFEILGYASNLAVKRMAWELGIVLLMNLEGSGDLFIFDEYEDEDEDEDELSEEYAFDSMDTAYSDEKGRTYVYDCVDETLEVDFEYMLQRMEEDSQDETPDED